MNRSLLKNSSWFIFLMGLLVYLYSHFISEKTTKETSGKTTQNLENLIQWAKGHLPQTGILREDRNGFVYLKVDDGYIYQLYPLLHDPNYRKPPYFRRADSPGAHISVFYVTERSQTGKIQEIGQSFSFKISELEAVPPKSQEYIVLKVMSPELEELRKNHGLSPLLNGHDFHITIAKRKNHLKHHPQHDSHGIPHKHIKTHEMHKIPVKNR